MEIIGCFVLLHYYFVMLVLDDYCYRQRPIDAEQRHHLEEKKKN